MATMINRYFKKKEEIGSLLCLPVERNNFINYESFLYQHRITLWHVQSFEKREHHHFIPFVIDVVIFFLPFIVFTLPGFKFWSY